MAVPTIDEAVIYLAKFGVHANKGNPGTVMPYLTQPLVAVMLKEDSYQHRTLEAAVCGPQSLGRAECDAVARNVAYNWTKLGGQCKWGDYRFDGKAAMHIVKVYATWYYE